MLRPRTLPQDHLANGATLPKQRSTDLFLSVARRLILFPGCGWVAKAEEEVRNTDRAVRQRKRGIPLVLGVKVRMGKEC